MKKKQLLNESEVRKFMKFANLAPLTENFVDSLEEEEGYGDMYEVMDDEEAPSDDLPPMDDMEAAPEDADLEVDDDPEAADASPEAVATAIIQGALEAAEKFGVEGSVEGDDEEALDPDLPGEDDELAMDMEAPPEGGDDLPLPGPEAEEETDELEEANLFLEDDTLEEDEMVSEVARRVAKRLVEAARSTQLEVPSRR